MFILQCLFVTFFNRFWGYFKKRVEYIDLRTEIVGLISEFIVAIIFVSIFDFIIWLIM